MEFRIIPKISEPTKISEKWFRKKYIYDTVGKLQLSVQNKKQIKS